MSVVKRAAGIMTTGLAFIGSAGAAFAQALGSEGLSNKMVWVYGAGALVTGVATGLQVWQPFGQGPATGKDVRVIVGKASQRSDDQFAILNEKVDRLLAATKVGDQGRGVAPDTTVRDQIVAIVESADPGVQAAIDRAIAEPGLQSREDTEQALIAAAENSKLEVAARLRELGAFQSLYSVGKAIETYREALRLDPGDFWTHVLLGRLLSLAHSPEAYEVAETCFALSKEGTWERSVACSELGNALIARNELSEALVQFRDGLEIGRNLSALDPEDDYLSRSVSVILNKIGTVLKRSGDIDEAIIYYEESLNIRRRLVALDSENNERKRDVSISLANIGDVQRGRNDFSNALYSYEEVLSIQRGLIEKNSTNQDYLRDVSVSLNRVGDMLREGGDLSKALLCYEEGLEIIRYLVSADPTNGEHTRDMSVSINKIGDMLVARNNFSEALAHYQEGLEIVRGLSALDPANMVLRRDVWVSLWRLASFREDQIAAWSEIVEELETMRRDGVLISSDEQYIAMARENLAAAQFPTI